MNALRSLLLGLTFSLLCTPSAIAGFNVQGMWWRSPAFSESGWGLNISHQGNILFVTWFTYDTDGSAMWLVMPRAEEGPANTYTGRLYRTTGPAFDSPVWSSSAVVATDVGSATLAFTDQSAGTLTFAVNGVLQTKPIARQVFGTLPVCSAGGAPGVPAVYQDMWWAAPAGSESGWGVNVNHQGDILFAAWFTYEAGGKGMWIVLPRADRVGSADVFAGDIYRTTGPAFSAEPWSPSQVVATRVGSASFSFTGQDNGTFTYTIGSITRAKAITRQVYASPATACRGPNVAQSGEYKLLSTAYGEYLLSIDFDLRRYAILSGDNVVSEGTFSGPVDGTYTFNVPGFSPSRNNARFRVADGLIVGSHPVGGPEAMPFVAANRFVASPSELPVTNMWMFSSDVQPASTPARNSRIMSLRLSGNQITYCSVASGQLTTVANCLPANLSMHALTFNGDNSITWFDNGAPVNFYLARSGSELIFIRAQSYAGSGNQRFQIALEDPKTRAASRYEGGQSDGSWGIATASTTNYGVAGFTSRGLATQLTGALHSAGASAAPLRSFSGSDGVPYFVQGSGILGTYIAARNSAKAGTIAFGVWR